ncbi:MAG: M13 family metallopeptidase [Prevotella sp.]|nr:M13 family metallopeptidase [Prevotella sp.]
MKTLFIIMALITAFSQGAKAQLASGIDPDNLDTSIRPQDDFYAFACGGWMKNNPLPAAYSRFGSFDRIDLENDKRINGILKELQNGKYEVGTLEQKISDLYKLAMDSVRRNAEGVSPAMPYINEMEAATDKAALEELQLKYAAFGYGVPYEHWFSADEKDSKNNILNVYQGGLTLGQKEYYLKNDSATRVIRDEYRNYIIRMFTLFGFDNDAATRKMESIMRVETQLAIASKSRTELRDVEKNYNKTTLEEFETDYPALRLTAIANAEGIDTKYMDTLVVGQPDFFAAADKIVSMLTTDELRALMEWNLIDGAANLLDDTVDAARFDFYGRVMSGRKQDYERWKKATSLVNRVLGEALGKIYCERYFPETSKKRMEALVANLQRSLGERIQAQTWMSDSTKAASLEKLATFYVKIGYPNKWQDYTKLTVNPRLSLFENMLGARLFRNNKEIEDNAGKPVDKDKWYMTPQTVNAYYNPTSNEICFPAGILQPPYFDATADDAFNYGAIGVVIGHEMTHGFDDQGSHYDKDGNMADWWQPSDVENFKNRTAAYADWFSKIKVLPDMNANGQMTLGENLADHGGLMVSYNAYRNATADSPLDVIDGFTPDQRFFLAYAGVWGQNITVEEIRNRTLNDVHALGEWRVNGALPHIKAWYEAFGVTPDDKMFIPESERLELW